MSIDPQHARALAEGLVRLATDFYRRGWMWGTSGNLSARLSASPLAIAITGSGASKGEMALEDIVVAPEEASAAVPWLGKGRARPSAETAIHLAVYRAVPEAAAVLHVHTVTSTALSLACAAEGAPLRIQGQEMLKGWGVQWVGDRLEAEVPVLSNKPSMEALAQDFSRLLAGGARVPVVLVAGHGMTVWGPTLEEARNHLEIAEFLCQVVWQGRLAASVSPPRSP